MPSRGSHTTARTRTRPDQHQTLALTSRCRSVTRPLHILHALSFPAPPRTKTLQRGATKEKKGRARKKTHFCFFGSWDRCHFCDVASQSLCTVDTTRSSKQVDANGLSLRQDLRSSGRVSRAAERSRRTGNRRHRRARRNQLSPQTKGRLPRAQQASVDQVPRLNSVQLLARETRRQCKRKRE